MIRIIVIGSPGSGKSTLAKALSNHLNLPLVHLDKLFWRDNWQCVSNKEFDLLLSKEVIKPQWIIDGNYNRNIEQRLKLCDTVIYLDFNRVRCLINAVKRTVNNYGRTRSDMGDNCPERLDLEFLKFIWDFNKNNRKNYYKILNELSDKKVVILKNHKQVNEFLQGCI